MIRVKEIIMAHPMLSVCMGSLYRKKSVRQFFGQDSRKVLDKMEVSGEKEADFMGNSGGLVHLSLPTGVPRGRS